ncbi:MAG: M1 family metallopeptidase [Gemmatimonadota bacterium]|nr:M1 family metallopeptidase [Gemmatimonadota bacterium]
MRSFSRALALLGAFVASASPLVSQTWEDRRPLPHPVVPPAEYRQAVEAGTRSPTGEPGPNYWQQSARYTIEARLLPDEKRVEGRETIVYYNRSPRPLPVLALYLLQNVYAEGAMRNSPAEVTGGIEIREVWVGDSVAREIQPGQRGAGYGTQGTNLYIRPPAPVAAGDSVQITLDWAFTLPQRGRQGWNADNLFFVAYWYPQMAVYDDVGGWQLDPFLGDAEFYAGFGTYDVTIEAPDGWVIMATGDLQNPAAVLAEPVLARYRQAHTSDSVVHVLTTADLESGIATPVSGSGTLRWRFHADSVRDFAWSATTASLWDAARIPVGDRDGDGRTDYVRGDAIYRPDATRWTEAWRYVQHSIEHHSRWTGIAYPWPHMTAVEGGGIMGGGMEYPMMTLISPFTEAPDTLLYLVVTHELAHMWVPMIVSTDERRYGWMDEGTTDFNELEAMKEFYPGHNPEPDEQEAYLQAARQDREGELMRLTDYQYPGAGGVASYQKPATLLIALRELLGEETFLRAYRTYLGAWAFKHPKPWDFFNVFNAVSGQNLDWFWSTWYYETWTLDHAVERVTTNPDGSATIVIEDKGQAFMPARVTITRENGQQIEREIAVEHWLAGNTRGEIAVPRGSPVVRVEIDARRKFPDIERNNDTWELKT